MLYLYFAPIMCALKQFFQSADKSLRLFLKAAVRAFCFPAGRRGGKRLVNKIRIKSVLDRIGGAERDRERSEFLILRLKRLCPVHVEFSDKFEARGFPRAFCIIF